MHIGATGTRYCIQNIGKSWCEELKIRRYLVLWGLNSPSRHQETSVGGIGTELHRNSASSGLEELANLQTSED